MASRCWIAGGEGLRSGSGCLGRLAFFGATSALSRKGGSSGGSSRSSRPRARSSLLLFLHTPVVSLHLATSSTTLPPKPTPEAANATLEEAPVQSHSSRPLRLLKPVPPPLPLHERRSVLPPSPKQTALIPLQRAGSWAIQSTSGPAASAFATARSFGGRGLGIEELLAVVGWAMGGVALEMAG